MKIVDRYIGQAVTIGVLSVVVVLVALFALINFANEADKIGRANYTVLSALMYTALRMPQQIYEIFPLGSLLGSMLGLGMLASHGELVVIRSAGVSISRVVVSALKSMVLLIVLVIFLGEVIAPPAQQYAIHSRLKALATQISLNTDYGLWARDGNTYIHVQRVEDDGKLVNVSLYGFDENLKMTSLLRAATGTFDGQQWVLEGVQKSAIGADKVVIRKIKELKWQSLLAPDLINVVTVSPQMLSSFKLWSYIGYLKDNELESTQYELALWNKLFMPLTIAAMVLLAVPFVFVSRRHTSLGRQIVLGFLVGIVFYILNRLAGQVGVVYNLPPALAAGLPTLIIMGVAWWLFRRVR